LMAARRMSSCSIESHSRSCCSEFVSPAAAAAAAAAGGGPLLLPPVALGLGAHWAAAGRDTGRAPAAMPAAARLFWRISESSLARDCSSCCSCAVNQFGLPAWARRGSRGCAGGLTGCCCCQAAGRQLRPGPRSRAR
jgi:hypothetical protein